MSSHRGKQATLTISNAPVGEGGFVVRPLSSHQPLGLDAPYREKLRPQFHFTALKGWLNDPNGLLYAGGRWHLFFQFDPYHPGGTTSKYWGHAVSTDLFHWQQGPIALFPFLQAVGEVYSGSAVVDRRNRAGFQAGKRPAFVALFTDTAERKGRPGPAECLAFSNDGGTTFQYYEKNPAIEHSGRDPKVFWYPPSQSATQAEGHWVMATYNSAAGKPCIDLYTSDNLRDWKLTDTHPGFYECPELVHLPVRNAEGKATGETRWVMWGADARYRIGRFDGSKFIPGFEPLLQTHFGAGYASQCWNDAPEGRVVQIFWLKIPFSGMPFNQMMSVPLELSLRETSSGLRLFAEPVREIKVLRGREYSAAPDAIVVPGQQLELPGALGQQFDIELALESPASGRVILELGRDTIVLTSGKMDEVPLLPGSKSVRLRVLVDRPSLEIIGNDGEIYLAKKRIDPGVDVPIRLRVEGAPVRVQSFRAYDLRSVWPPSDFPMASRR